MCKKNPTHLPTWESPVASLQIWECSDIQFRRHTQNKWNNNVTSSIFQYGHTKQIKAIAWKQRRGNSFSLSADQSEIHFIEGKCIFGKCSSSWNSSWVKKKKTWQLKSKLRIQSKNIYMFSASPAEYVHSKAVGYNFTVGFHLWWYCSSCLTSCTNTFNRTEYILHIKNKNVALPILQWNSALEQVMHSAQVTMVI